MMGMGSEKGFTIHIGEHLIVDVDKFAFLL